MFTTYAYHFETILDNSKMIYKTRCTNNRIAKIVGQLCIEVNCVYAYYLENFIKYNIEKAKMISKSRL